MVGRARGHHELWEEEYKEDSDDNWNTLLMRVQDYATKRRLESNLMKGNGDPMDIAKVNQEWGDDPGEWDDWWGAGGCVNEEIVAGGWQKEMESKERGIRATSSEAAWILWSMLHMPGTGAFTEILSAQFQSGSCKLHC